MIFYVNFASEKKIQVRRGSLCITNYRLNRKLMDKKLQSSLKRLSVCLLLSFMALQAMAQEFTVPDEKDGYFNILTNDGKYVNVAGRRTVTFVNESSANTKAGTVIRVKTNNKGQVEILRSQGVDIPSYAERTMNYVPKIVQLVVDKLHAEGSGEILGTDGLDAIMAIFDECFDYHLYIESAGDNTYRIYGKTPSMRPIVEFYDNPENKAKVDAKLPQLEQFINDAIHKLLNKTGGSGASILVDFSLHTVWEKMGGASSGLPEPKDDASISAFYSQVLSTEDNVWNFAYQTAMIYWGNLKNHPRFEEIKDKLGDYAQYIDKVENIRPNFKYYIVPGTSTLDIISEGNANISDASTAWTLQPCTEFTVNFPDANKRGDKYYTTLYTDFAYTLPEGVTAMKVTEVSEAGVAKTEEILGKTIPAQTPILLVSTAAGDQTLAPTTDAGTAVTGNLLNGPDYLINTYGIKTAQVEWLFSFAKDLFGESFYNNYIAEYEHLMARNAGTVNNKYFFGLTDNDLYLCNSSGSENDCVVRSLDVDDNNKLAFSDRWTVAANKAFLVSDKHDVIKLFLKGDINMDGLVDVADVTTLVDYILERNPSPCDVDACDVNEDTKKDVSDVTTLVDIILER